MQDPEKPIPDPGYRGQKGTGSRIRIRNTEKKAFLVPTVSRFSIDLTKALN